VPTSSATHSEVAVVIPCYNVEQYLPRALNSVLAQTYQDFWIYAVDDGSADSTQRILDEYSHCCVSISQAHSGPAAARNRAIRASSSPFIAFIDADDEWLPDKLDRQIDLLKQNPALGMVCSFCSVNESGSNDSAQVSPNGMPHNGRLFEHLARNCFVFTPTVVVRRRCLEEVGLFNESLTVSEDFNLWLRIAARWEIAVVPEVLAIAHKRPGSLSVSISPELRLRSGVASLQHVTATCPALSAVENRALRLALAERIYFYGSYLLSIGANAASRNNLASVLKLQPTHCRALAKLALSFLPSATPAALAEQKSTIRF
jgi:glycosyltransferase involved in cell wall biosynthesis